MGESRVPAAAWTADSGSPSIYKSRNMAYKFGYVPPPMPDETLYSVLAAKGKLFHDREMNRRLLGAYHLRARLDWPTGLELVAAAFPSGLALDAERLLLEHTQASLHLPFLSAPRRADFINSMMKVNSGRSWLICGCRTASTKMSARLRACPQCLQEDNRKGRAYWHRVHQCAGVLVCPLHPDQILVETSVQRDDRYQFKAYCDVSDAELLSPVADRLSLQDLGCARDIATQVAIILNGAGAVPVDINSIRRVLRDAVLEKGYAMRSGSNLDRNALHDAFLDWCSVPLANALGVPRPRRPSSASWLCRIFHHDIDSLNPLLVIIFCLFLKIDITDVLNEATICSPREPMRRGGKLAKMPLIHRRFEEAKPTLRRLWRNQNIPVVEIARRLNVAASTVPSWAASLGLPFPRRAKGCRAVRDRANRPTRRDMKRLIREKRKQWLETIKKSRGGHSRNPVSASLYRWLWRNDPAWLHSHISYAKPAPRIDWRLRDLEYAKKLPPLVMKLKQITPPVFVSRTRLANALGDLTRIFRWEAKFPITIERLAALAESREDFTLRRILYLDRCGILQRWQLQAAVKQIPKTHPRISELKEIELSIG